MRPDPIVLHIRRVEEGLGGIEDHAMDAGVGGVGVVLHIGVQGAVFWSYGEDIAVAGVVVEGVSVDVVRGLLGGEVEDGSSVGLGVLGLC